MSVGMKISGDMVADNLPEGAGLFSVLTSGTIDLTGTTPVDIAVPVGKKFFPISIMIIGLGNVDVNSLVDVGIIATPDLFWNNLPILAARFNAADDFESFSNPVSSNGVTAIRLTPDGAASAGTVIAKLSGILN